MLKQRIILKPRSPILLEGRRWDIPLGRWHLLPGYDVVRIGHTTGSSVKVLHPHLDVADIDAEYTLVHFKELK